MNKRSDQWGGTTDNRFRIVREILSDARKAVGDYPILAKINAYEKSKDGMDIKEAVRTSKLLEEFGCDGIEVSSGIVEDGFWTARGGFPFDIIAEDDFRLKGLPKMVKPIIRVSLEKRFASPEPYELFNLSSAERIKKEVNIPVIVVGGIKKSVNIKAIIENDKCDFVSMSRPFIIEPDIVNKFKEGSQTESKCIYCNYCLIGMETHPLRCYYGKLRAD
jgi:2,4-dienoyl-CoA reductase-like NADH-dependent reductase (Old Yellow Enzyme family)